jgi:hypothetical protein
MSEDVRDRPPQPSIAGGAKAMVADGLRDRIPKPDVAFSQHVLAHPAGTIGTEPGPIRSAGVSIRMTLHGKGTHGSMPHTSVDAVVLAGRVDLDIPVNHSELFAPVIEPTLSIGTQALVGAALTYLAK